MPALQEGDPLAGVGVVAIVSRQLAQETVDHVLLAIL
jgi:hypothetical protein